MKKSTRFKIPSKYILFVMTILCVGLILVTFTTDIALSPIKQITGYTIVPVQNGINKIGMWFSDKTDDLKKLREVMKENEELQAQVDELTIENSRLRQERFEVDRLSELFELDQKYPNYNKVAARITGKDPGNWFNTFLIDKGTDDGIAVDMNVIAGSGLVGRIIDVGPNWATVRSIIDDSNNVSGMVLETEDICNIAGDLELMENGIIRMTNLIDSDDNVQVGNQIVTSYVSEKYLQGLLVGYITELKTDANNLTKSGYISPVVDFEHLETVLVITDLK